MKRVLCSVMFLIVAAAIPVGAGDKKKDEGQSKVERGPEHKILESLVGTFDAEVKVFFPDPTKPQVSKGEMKRTMVLGGNFLQENFTGEFFGSKFAGIGLVGYDSVLKKYTTVWCDSMSTSMMMLEGSFDDAKKTLTYVGEDVEPNSKKRMKARDTLKMVSADVQQFEMFRQPEGEKKDLKVMEITYTRQKAK